MNTEEIKQLGFGIGLMLGNIFVTMKKKKDKVLFTKGLKDVIKYFEDEIDMEKLK